MTKATTPQIGEVALAADHKALHPQLFIMDKIERKSHADPEYFQ